MRDKAFDIATNPKYDRYQRGIASTVYKSFDKKTFDSIIKSENMSDQQLAEELHKLIIKKCKCVIDIFSKYVWVIPLKDRKGLWLRVQLQSQLLMLLKKL